jgi:hypothetical protein
VKARGKGAEAMAKKAKTKPLTDAEVVEAAFQYQDDLFQRSYDRWFELNARHREQLLGGKPRPRSRKAGR